MITETDLQHELTANGVTLRQSDFSGRATLAIQDAAAECLQYVGLRYSIASLQTSYWYAMQNKYVAAWKFCTYAGNPPPMGVQMKYEKAIQDLELIQAGTKQIADCPQSKAAVPVMSQPRVRQSPVPITVIETGRSTGTPEGYNQRVDQVEQNFDYRTG